FSVVYVTRLQGSLHATARVLAPSTEALDAPLSPPPLNDEPGPATGHSGVYPDGTSTRRPGPASRTQHDNNISGQRPLIQLRWTPSTKEWTVSTSGERVPAMTKMTSLPECN